MMPDIFRTESDLQRQEAIDELAREAFGYSHESADTWPLTFRASNDARLLFRRAAAVAAKLGRDDAATIESVTFRPYPSKSPGFWRIEIGLTRGTPYAGAEWYVHEDDLWKAWEETA